MSEDTDFEWANSPIADLNVELAEALATIDSLTTENEKLHAFVSWLTGVCVDHDLNTLVRQEIRPALARLREQMEVGE